MIKVNMNADSTWLLLSYLLNWKFPYSVLLVELILILSPVEGDKTPQTKGLLGTKLYLVGLFQFLSSGKYEITTALPLLSWVTYICLKIICIKNCYLKPKSFPKDYYYYWLLETNVYYYIEIVTRNHVIVYTPLLPLLPGPLWSGMEAPNRALSMC